MTRRHQQWTHFHRVALSKVEQGSVPKRVSLLPKGYLRKHPCPDCPAQAGEACISHTTGKPSSMVHISRRRIAIRAYREEQEARDD